MYDSFVRYQTRLIRVFDRLAKPYCFEVVDAGRPAEQVFEALQTAISDMLTPGTRAKRTAGLPREPPGGLPRWQTTGFPAYVRPTSPRPSSLPAPEPA